MKEIKTVFHHQYSLFQQEKGMHVYYLIALLFLGVISPLFVLNFQANIIMNIMTTAMILRPMLVDSFALENEQKTLESLFSTPVQLKHIILGKSLFCFIFAAIFYSCSLLGVIALHWIQANFFESTTNVSCFSTEYCIQIAVILLFSLLIFYTISLLGVYASLKAVNTIRANRKISLITYSLSLLLIVFIAILFTGHQPAILISVFCILLVELILLCCFQSFLSHKKLSDYYEIQTKTDTNTQEHTSLHTPRSQFGAVVRHEARYFMKLRSLQLNYLILIFAPAVFLCLLCHNQEIVDLDCAVVLTALMMPRIPMNLVSYAIGGEKAYKTGESLLSTPLRVRSMFLGKSLMPILVSAFILASSSLISLGAASIMQYYLDGSCVTFRYSTTQLILLYPVTMLTCTLMIFFTGILSAVMSTPRKGLYVSSVISSLFILPVYIIIYLTKNPLFYSIAYCIILLLCNLAFIFVISERISRPKLLDRL